MLPVYISYFAAGRPDKRTALANSAGFVLGFTVIFVAMGALAGSAGRLLNDHITVLNIITGLIVIVFGLNFMGVLKISLLNRATGKSADVGNLRFFSSVIFGMVFSIGWTPCVGAFLGSALMLASLGGSVFQGVTMLLTFSLGLGIPFVACAFIIDRLKGAFDFIKRHYKIINTVSGCLLVITGILMATGYMGYMLAFLTV